jgi:glycosyltransferase involved in cell wall biosynthesis
MHRILVDGRFIGVGESIQRYTLEILKRILVLDHKNQYTLLVRPQGKKIAEEAQASLASKASSSRKLKANSLQLEVLDVAHYSIGEQTKLLSYLNKKKFDLVHFTQFNHPIRYRGNYVISIHDLTMFGHLHRMNPLKKLGFVGVMRSAVKDSKKIITISNTSKKDIVTSYKVDPKKIVVTHLGVDDKFNSKIKNSPKGGSPFGRQKSKILNFKGKYGIGENYILYTGMWKKHKNLIRLFKAFEIFRKKVETTLIDPADKAPKRKNGQRSTVNDMQLVLVGKIDKGEPEVLREIERINKELNRHPTTLSELRGTGKSSPQINTNNDSKKLKAQEASEAFEANKPIVTAGFIEEEELPVAYAGALAYIIPSLSEGFGLPPLEAMACGTPVLSARTSAMPEILGNAPLYFDPYNISDIANKIEKLVGDKKLQSELSKRGLEQVKKYTWESTAKETLDVYQEILD